MSPTIPKSWQLFADSETLAQACAECILKTAAERIDRYGSFHLITAGGSTPNRCYQILQQSVAEWSKWHIYMGDERVLPVDDPERNSQALLKNWLEHSEIPPEQIHFIRTEQGAERAALEYAGLVDSVERFDLALLGMGEDGHTASLFPGHHMGNTLTEVHPVSGNARPAEVVIESDSPKAPSLRVSLSASLFSRCALVLKLISGEGKRAAVQKWLRTPANDKTALPIQTVVGRRTKVLISQDALPE